MYCKSKLSSWDTLYKEECIYSTMAMIVPIDVGQKRIERNSESTAYKL